MKKKLKFNFCLWFLPDSWAVVQLFARKCYSHASLATMPTKIFRISSSIFWILHSINLALRWHCWWQLFWLAPEWILLPFCMLFGYAYFLEQRAPQSTAFGPYSKHSSSFPSSCSIFLLLICHHFCALIIHGKRVCWNGFRIYFGCPHQIYGNTPQSSYLISCYWWAHVGKCWCSALKGNTKIPISPAAAINPLSMKSINLDPVKCRLKRTISFPFKRIGWMWSNASYFWAAFGLHWPLSFWPDRAMSISIRLAIWLARLYSCGKAANFICVQFTPFLSGGNYWSPTMCLWSRLKHCFMYQCAFSWIRCFRIGMELASSLRHSALHAQAWTLDHHPLLGLTTKTTVKYQPRTRAWHGTLCASCSWFCSCVFSKAITSATLLTKAKRVRFWHQGTTFRQMFKRKWD